MRMLIYEDMSSRYCPKEVNICHGSRYMKDATKYNPKVANRAMMMMPPALDDPPKKLEKNSSAVVVSTVAPLIPRTARYIDNTMMYALMKPKTTNDMRYVILEPLGLLPSARTNWVSKNARYRYFRIVLIMGVAVSPKGQPWCSAAVAEAATGSPTRSMITVVVNQ